MARGRAAGGSRRGGRLSIKLEGLSPLRLRPARLGGAGRPNSAWDPAPQSLFQAAWFLGELEADLLMTLSDSHGQYVVSLNKPKPSNLIFPKKLERF